MGFFHFVSPVFFIKLQERTFSMSHSGPSAADDDGSANASTKRRTYQPYPAMLAYWDKNELCRFVNNAGLEWFNQNPESVIGKMSIRDFVGQELYNENRYYIRSALSGHPHVFERSLKANGKGEISAMVTFIPDISKGETQGFYLQVTDVGHLKKKSDAKLADEKELLRAIIDIQEKERSQISEILRDNVNQLLVYVNLMMQGKNNNPEQGSFSEDMKLAIHQAVLELNKLSNQLYPSALSLLGLLPSIENLISNFRQTGSPDISFYCNDPQIEELSHKDKLSVYRIVQDFIGLILNRRKSSYIITELSYRDFCLMIRIVYNGEGANIDHRSDEFRDIRSRIEYYSGKIREFHREDEKVFIAHLVFHPAD
jgi:PAS fold